MAENYNNNEQVPTGAAEAAAPVETTDRGIFDFLKKDEDTETKPVVEEDSKFASEFDEKVKVSEPEPVEEEEKHHDTLLDKFHQEDDKSSSSCSSSDEEDDEEKKKKKAAKKEKKGLKEKLVEKLPGHKEEDTNVPVEKPYAEEEVAVSSEPHHEEDVEKKGLLDKIKDKISGENKVEEHPDIVAPVAPEPTVVEGEEKRGFMDKIKDKLPGFGSKDTEDKKDQE